MDNLSEFFAMNGYAAFIWPAYGVTVIVLAGMFTATLLKSRKLKREEKLLKDLK